MGDVSEEDWSEFELYSDGDYCASASGKRAAAWAEILHYMTIYAQDGGEMTVQEIIRNTVNVQLEPPPKAANPESTIEEVAANAGWRPIETAPKDRKARLIWTPTNQNTYLASWFSGDDREEPGWAIFGAYHHVLREPVTHWMPLPNPPKAAKPHV